MQSRGRESGEQTQAKIFEKCLQKYLTPGEQTHAGGGGRPRDAGAGLQHGPGRRESHEARIRPQDLPHPQRLSKCERGNLIQFQYVQRNAGTSLFVKFSKIEFKK